MIHRAVALADLFHPLSWWAFGRPQWIAKLPAKGALPPCGDTREGKGAQGLVLLRPLLLGRLNFFAVGE